MAERLTPSVREQIAALYDDRLDETGDDVGTVGWGSRADQALRFALLLRDVDVRGRRVLDVGCGLGDLVAHLDAVTSGDFDYTGIDIATRLVDRARELRGGDRRRFLVAELADLGDEQFDVVLCSGALTVETGANEVYARAAMSRMFAVSSDVVAVNFLSSYVDFEAPKNHHFDPSELFRFAKTLTPYVALLHDYPLWEFTLQLRRRPLTIELPDGRTDAHH